MMQVINKKLLRQCDALERERGAKATLRARRDSINSFTMGVRNFSTLRKQESEGKARKQEGKSIYFSCV